MLDKVQEKFNLKIFLIKLFVLATAIGLVYYIRPLFHSLIYATLYSPGLFIIVGLGSIIGIVSFLSPPIEKKHTSSIETKITMFGYVIVVLLVVGMAVGIVGGIFEQRTLATQTMDKAESVGEFPKSNADNPRIITRGVSDVQTRGSTSYRTHQLGVSDIARGEDGNLVWSYPIQPDQFQNRLNGNQIGILTSDMTTMEESGVNVYDNNTFVYGQNQLLHRSAEWNVKKNDYLSAYEDDPVEFMHDGEAYMMYPKTGHEWHLTPVPHTTPTWNGVALVHQDGTIENLSPEEAQESEILDGQRLYPLYNARQESESLRYRNGIINQMPLLGSYDGVIEPATLPSNTGNSQPFVIDMDNEKMSYVYAFEPTGEDSRGLDEVWFYNSNTGTIEYFETDSNTLLGPERAVGIVRGADTQTDWDTEDSTGQFKVVEPIPTVVNDELWWHTKVVPRDNTDVTRNSFVNAHSGDVVEFDTTETIKEFLQTGNLDDLDDGDVVEQEPSDEPNVAYEIVIRDANGTVVDRIPITDDQEVTFE